MGLDIRTDRERLLRNLKTLKEKAKNKLICAVVKANAYGHGANIVSSIVQNEVDYFAVATPCEGVELRKNGIKKPILLLSFKTEDADICVENDLTVSVFTMSQIMALEHSAKVYNKTPCAHLKIDTGMNRFGVKTLREAKQILATTKNVLVNGVYTHFYSAESIDKQTEKFLDFEKLVKEYNSLAISHLSATTAVLSGAVYGDMVRLGIGLYGYPSSNLCPVMQVKSRILAIKELSKGEISGYNGVYSPNRKTKIAIVDGGYADGVSRSFLGNVSVLCKGKMYKIVAVCMDSFIIEINDSNLSVGDEVLLIGESEGKSIDAECIAEAVNTIPYEIITSFGNLARR